MAMAAEEKKARKPFPRLELKPTEPVVPAATFLRQLRTRKGEAP
jgi:hypothetical protein